MRYVVILVLGCLIGSAARPLAAELSNPVRLPALQAFQGKVGGEFVPSYKDSACQALAIDAARHKDKYAAAEAIFAGPTGIYDLVLTTLTETDGESTYRVLVGENQVGEFTNPEAEEDYQEINFRVDGVALSEGDVIRVEFNSASNGKIPEGNAFAYARGRWRALTLLMPGESFTAAPVAPEKPAGSRPEPAFVFDFDPAACDEVFEEKDGLLVVEAEHFAKQSHTDVRKWYLVTPDQTPDVQPDGDENHAAMASGEAYLELLPDTRRTHGDPLIHGENFTEVPGQMAVLYYPVYFNTPGRYYVWARICATGSEDNGLHVGIDGQWPASGRRMQWVGMNGQWQWDTKQRTEANHTGERYKIWLDVNQPGLHTIMFSMREDGFELDKWLMSLDRDVLKPQDPGVGPPESPRRKP